MKKRLLETATASGVVDPLAVLARSVRHAEHGTARREMTYEVELDPPAGAQVQQLVVAGSYRSPVPIMFDFGTRTAYPVRTTGR